MRASLIAICSILLPAFAAEPRWSRMQSPNFEMYTTAGERSARDTLRYFEQIHSFFAQTMPPLQKPLPVRIVAFNSAKEYEPYRPNEFAVAYYHSTADCDYIVMSHTGSETFPVAVHEYVHLVVQHANMKLPPWLNEGVAELYSTLRPMGDKILVGSLVAGRHYALLNEKWVPLATILDADHSSAYYNEKNKAGSLYNEGWALTHMLALDNDYRAKFSELLRDISNGKPSRQAVEDLYGKPLSAIEKELSGYLRGGRFQGALIPAKLPKIGDELAAEPAADFDVKLLLTRLKDRRENARETQEALESLAASDPKRPEPHADLAYLHWRENRNSEAAAEFGKAFDLGSRGAKLLWDYGRLAESRDAQGSIRAFSELLKQEPSRIDVRMELANVQLRSQQPKEAVETLKPVKKITPEDAPRFLTLIAYGYLQSGDRDEARKAAEQLKRVALNVEQKNTADQILKFLDAPARASLPQVRAGGADERARLQRREAPPMTLEVRTAAPKWESVTGKFVELQCADPAKIVLETADGKKILMIDDPAKLLVNGQNGVKMDLTCGPQKPVSVRIDYAPAGPNQNGVHGLARAIHFE